MLCFGYTRLTMASNLSPEQFLGKLASVVQPPNYEGTSVPQPDNEKIIFVGKIANSGFSVSRFQRSSKGRREAPPPQIKCVLQETASGSNIRLLILPNWQSTVLVSFAFLFWVYIAISTTRFGLENHDGFFTWLWLYFYVPYLLLIYGSWIVWPIRNEVRTIRKTLMQIIENQPIKVMMR